MAKGIRTKGKVEFDTEDQVLSYIDFVAFVMLHFSSCICHIEYKSHIAFITFNLAHAHAHAHKYRKYNIIKQRQPMHTKLYIYMGA